MAKTGLIALIFISLLWQNLSAQEFPIPHDSLSTLQDPPEPPYYEAWSFEAGYEEDYISKPEYKYEEPLGEKNWFEQLKERLENAWKSFWTGIWDGVVISGFGKLLSQLAPYVLILALMALLVWLAIKYSSGKVEDRKIGFSNLSADEVLLRNKNLKSLAEEALKSQDFRLALRYRYLLVLQELIHRKLIVWKSSKTNYDYQKELKETPFLASFTEVTRIYNFVWYGHFDLDEKTYGELEGAFNHLDQLP